MTTISHTASEELSAGLEQILQSPKDAGVLELIVRRPGVDAREPLQQGELDPKQGLVGDSWSLRKNDRAPDGLPHPDTQLNIMNARTIALIAGDRERWQLAGDQLFIDLDLSYDNLPPGTRLAIGSALVEVTAEPHRGCGKFADRFGVDATKFVNSAVGKAHNLRGVNARVVQAGTIRVGDVVTKVQGDS